ncbi:MAG: carbamate kinase, partial [Candidatus Thermoplasmatota archaeon]|nr:carbamate kinase [Candidatus Thermoplasmatota archaeon]
MARTAIVAIGGNSLIADQEHKSVEEQFKISNITCKHIVDMIEDGWDVVITHGNGPQVGFILLRSEISSEQIHSVPLDSVGADTQGAIGYMLQQNLYNEFLKRRIDKKCCTVITQCVVDEKDPGFQNPTKPIGPVYTKEDAIKKKESENWDIVEIPNKGWRRVVASPLPRRIIEMESIRELIHGGFIVIAVGGGGIPVVEDNEGILHGTAAVIDKDLASSLLAAAGGGWPRVSSAHRPRRGQSSCDPVPSSASSPKYQPARAT